MLAISIGLIISMLIARAGVSSKINELKQNTATAITVTPAGIRGAMGGGDPLTSEQVTKIAATPHVASVNATLTDQLGSSDTNLTSSLELGSFGQRQQRFEQSESSTTLQANENTSPEMRPAPTPRVTVTGTTTPSVTSEGTTLNVTNGTLINGNGEDLNALIGSKLAAKNNLSVGSTFTAYGKTIKVAGIYTTDNQFEDNGIIMPLKTVQTLSNQAGAVTNVAITADSSENVGTITETLTSSLGATADITSQEDQAKTSLSALEDIQNITTAGVIGASIAGAIIVLLAMTMIVRERKREIGVMKAIGSPTSKVIGQFTTEAIGLTIIGGLIGAVIGVAVSGPITSSLVNNQSQNTTVEQGGGPGMRFGRSVQTSLRDISTSATPTVFISAAFITLAIAIIGSALPAWIIARVEPAEVLRSE